MKLTTATHLPESGLQFFIRPIFHLHVLVLTSISVLCLQPAGCLGTLGNATDQHALLQFRAKITNDPYGIFNSWNHSVNLCSWRGVTCGRKHQRVTSLNLYGMGLFGTISPYIGNLTFLRFLILRNNSFHGVIPEEVGRLSRLRHLNLTDNKLEGNIPLNITSCSKLQILVVANNMLVGRIRAELSLLQKLESLDLYGNNFTGEIPHSFGNISSFKQLSLSFNKLQGNIPKELGKLASLTYFSIGVNNLTGTIPFAIYNISSISVFSVQMNQLTGSLPVTIGLTLPNLQKFYIGGNQFYGTIPVSFTNSSQLEIFDVSQNSFAGQVPNNLGHLKGLKLLNLEFNSLGSNSSQDLSFIASLSNCSNLESLYFDTNNFGGVLPDYIANLSAKLSDLGIGANQISGRLPSELGNLVSLYVLGMEKNLFSGNIPDSFGKFQNLQLLDLSGNLLTGHIPPCIGNLSQLFDLNLEENKFEGNITSSIGKCQNLQELNFAKNNLTGFIPKEIIGLFSLSNLLNLSQNALTGPLPLEVQNLKNINVLDVSQNKLSGEIPETIGDCLLLETLSMQGNFFQGPIPLSFSSMRGLQHLDLSRNNLSGYIPKQLEKLPFLKYLNLSFNNLGGEVPKQGVFSNTRASSIVGNKNLCGGIPELQLPACAIKRKKQKMSSTAIILTATISSIVLFLALTSSWICYRQKPRKNRSSNPFTVDKLLRISYKELLQATQGFSSGNLIGQGTFGSVYKGSLDLQGERLVAVKVLNLQQHGASKSFIAECKALRNIRHRNLVKILTYCSSIDFKGIDFKALVFDFMTNGSLEMWLHPKEDGSGESRNLNLLQRLQVAIDVSSALHYLHDQCETPIIHCDLKPSNILLDMDMAAHVGDFGIARLHSKINNNCSEVQSSSIGIKGTIGYMAPEYGTGSEATTLGDVYSFGIILLELFTGRRPTDEMFADDLNLHNFVRDKLPGQFMQVVDPILIATGEVGAEAETMESNDIDDDGQTEIQEENANTGNLRLEGGNVHKCILSVLKIGLACSVELPGDRMNMKDVTRKLNSMLKAFLRARTNGDRRIATY